MRQFGEVLAQLVAARSGLFSDARETLFHQVRTDGNPATHQGEGDHATALACLKMARQLAIWFYRTFDDHNLKAGPFHRKRRSADNRRAGQSGGCRGGSSAFRCRKGGERCSRRKVLWKQLAAEAEVAKIKLAEQVAMLMAARHPAAAEEYLELEPHVASHHFRVDQAPAPPAMDRGIDEFELAQQLVTLQEAAESSSPAEQQQVPAICAGSRRPNQSRRSRNPCAG